MLTYTNAYVDLNIPTYNLLLTLFSPPLTIPLVTLHVPPTFDNDTPSRIHALYMAKLNKNLAY